MKVHPIPHVIFEIKKAGSIQILHRCLVSSKIAPLQFFSSNLIHFLQKYPIKIQVFKLFTACVKVYQITYLAFQIKSPFSFKVWITLQCNQISFFCSFVAEILYAIDKTRTWECIFSYLPLFPSKFTKFLMSFLETRANLLLEPQITLHCH